MTKNTTHKRLFNGMHTDKHMNKPYIYHELALFALIGFLRVLGHLGLQILHQTSRIHVNALQSTRKPQGLCQLIFVRSYLATNHTETIKKTARLDLI